MDYEKAYNGLVAKIKIAHMNAQTDSTKNVLADILPELRESEDERIRKALIQFLTEIKNISEGGRDSWHVRKEDAGMCDSFLSYLEKQKEPKKDIELIQRSWYMEGYHDREFGKEPKWILKTGEGGPKYELNPRHGYYIKNDQESVEYDDIKKTVLEDFGLCDNGYDPMNVLMTIKRKWPMVWKTMLANESTNAKPVEWNEEVEKKIIFLERLIRYNVPEGQYGYMDKSVTKLQAIAMLQSLRPVKQEWSEKDERMRNGLISLIEEIKLRPLKRMEDWDGYTHFLKSLRPSWKPSEEQMMSLRLSFEEAFDDAGDCNRYRRLKSLYEQLEKL